MSLLYFYLSLSLSNDDELFNNSYFYVGFQIRSDECYFILEPRSLYCAVSNTTREPVASIRLETHSKPIVLQGHSL